MLRTSTASRRQVHVLGRHLRRVATAAVLTFGLSTLPLASAVAAPTDVVTFDDPVFRTCVAGALGMPGSSPVTVGQAASLTSLDCGELAPASFAGAESLTSLTTLSVSYGSTVSDLAPLAGLSRLRELSLPFSRVLDLTPLRGLTGLERLDVYGNPVHGLAPLAALTRLTYLDITGSSWTTLEPLRHLTALRRLNADQEGQVDISAIAGLTALEQLNLSVPDVRSIAPLRNLTRLTQLTVQAGATDISAVAPLRRLRTLSLNVSDGDGAALVDKPELTELSVYGVRLPSLDPLAASTRLSWLLAVAHGIKDVSALRRMPELSEVILSGVDRADLSPLGALPQLSYLSVSSSRLGPLRQLAGFAALTVLELNDDQVDSLDGFRVPANVTSLNLSANHLADISMLPCTLLVNALAQTVEVGRARVGQPYRLPLTSIPEQSVRLDSSASWTSSGTTITYASPGSYRVPFVGEGSPDCSGVQFSGVVSQSVVAGSKVRPPHDR